MKKMNIIEKLHRVNVWRTLVANFSCLKWKDAIKLPIVVAKGSRFTSRAGGGNF